MSTATPVSRRRRLLGLALATALVGPLVTPLVLGGTAAPSAAATLTLRQPMPADAVVDMVGINVHTASREHYGDKARVTAALRELGVRHVRDRVYTNRPDQYDRLRALGAEGIGLNVIAGDPTLAGGTPEAIVQTAVRELPGMVESYEGANEWNLKRRPNWAAELRAHQTRLYGAVRANPVHSRVPVMAPALGQREGREELGSLAGIADLGNNHLYMGGREPSWLVDQELSRERALKVPNKQVVVTEAGYHDAMVDPTTHFPTPQDVSADYLPRWVMEYAKRDALTHQVYLYQLMDEGTNNADREDKFGLVRPDFTRKPGFTALKNTLALFEDPGGYQPQPTPLALGVTSTATDVQTLVTQRRDGSYVLAVWRRTSSWQQKDEVRLAVPAVPVTLDLATAMDAAVHTPTTSATPRSTATRTTRVNLSVGNGLQVVKLTAPVSTPPPTTPPPTTPPPTTPPPTTPPPTTPPPTTPPPTTPPPTSPTTPPTTSPTTPSTPAPSPSPSPTGDVVAPSSRLALSATATGSGDLVAVGAKGVPNHLEWSAEEGLGRPRALSGQTDYAPALTRAPDGSLDALVVGTNGALYSSRQAAGSSSWSPWTRVGGALVGRPAATTWPDGTLQVFAAGTDRAVWQTWRTPQGRWAGWHKTGGLVAAGTGVSVSSAPDRTLTVAVHGADHAVWTTGWRPGGGWQRGWTSLGGALLGDPAVAVDGASGRAVVVVRGTDHVAYARDVSGPGAAGWTRLGGVLGGSPAVSTVPGAGVDVVVVAPGDRLLHLTRTRGSWSAWS